MPDMLLSVTSVTNGIELNAEQASDCASPIASNKLTSLVTKEQASNDMAIAFETMCVAWQ